MALRDITESFRPLLQRLGALGGGQLRLRDEADPTVQVADWKYFAPLLGAQVCFWSGNVPAVGGQYGHFWLDQGAAIRVFPLTFQLQVDGPIHVINPGVSLLLDNDVPTTTAQPPGSNGLVAQSLVHVGSNTQNPNAIPTYFREKARGEAAAHLTLRFREEFGDLLYQPTGSPPPNPAIPGARPVVHFQVNVVATAINLAFAWLEVRTPE